MKFKKLLAALLAVMMVASMAACGTSTASSAPAETGSEAPAATEAPAAEETTEAPAAEAGSTAEAVEFHMQLRLLLLQLPQLGKASGDICPLRQYHSIGQHRRHHSRFLLHCLCPKSFTGTGLRQSQRRHHITGVRFLHCLILGSGIHSQLSDLFSIGQSIPHMEYAAGDLHVTHALILFIP